MIEDLDTAVALSAMEGIIRDAGLANLAKIVIVLHIEAISLDNFLPVKQLDRVTGVDAAGLNPEHRGYG